MSRATSNRRAAFTSSCAPCPRSSTRGPERPRRHRRRQRHSYGKASDEPGGYRAVMEREVGDRIDWDRVHFLGRVPYASYCSLLQISRCHVYLTVPFVLSWSLLEAMSMGATDRRLRRAPVREVLEHGKTGLLVDFFDPAGACPAGGGRARQPRPIIADLGRLPAPRYGNLRLPHPRAAHACGPDQRSRRAQCHGRRSCRWADRPPRV
jgi:hypothetical protein